MRRTPLPPNPLTARKLYSHLAAAGSLILFVAVVALLGRRFGRVEQQVPDGTHLRDAALARHTAELTAEGVVRTTLQGCPVTIFDLELINDVDLAELGKRVLPGRATECAKEYLTVTAVTLPFTLPYVSALTAWHRGLAEEVTGLVDPDEQDVPAELRHTDDPELAALLLSVPEVKQAAQTLDHLWVISGDQLVTAKLTNTGLDPAAALYRATVAAGIAAALPWDRLAAFRREPAAPAPWRLHRSPFLAHQWWLDPGVLGPGVLRWGHTDLTGKGLLALTGGGVDLGEPR